MAERIDTSASGLGATGMWTRRPSDVMTTATARRSWRSNRPKLASRRVHYTAPAVRCAQSSRVRPLANVPPMVLGMADAYRRAAGHRRDLADSARAEAVPGHRSCPAELQAVR